MDCLSVETTKNINVYFYVFFLQFSNLVTVASPLVPTAPPNMLCSAPVGIFSKMTKGASPVQCLQTILVYCLSID